MQAFPGFLLFSGCELPMLPRRPYSGEPAPPILCLILLNTGLSKAPPRSPHPPPPHHKLLVGTEREFPPLAVDSDDVLA